MLLSIQLILQPKNETFAACDGDAATPAFDFLSKSKDDTRMEAKKLLELVERLREGR